MAEKFNLITNENTTPEQSFLATAIVSQQRAGFRNRVDVRIVKCPNCKSVGLNDGWGALVFMCGAELLMDGEGTEAAPCGNVGVEPKL